MKEKIEKLIERIESSKEGALKAGDELGKERARCYDSFIISLKWLIDDTK